MIIALSNFVEILRVDWIGQNYIHIFNFHYIWSQQLYSQNDVLLVFTNFSYVSTVTNEGFCNFRKKKELSRSKQSSFMIGVSPQVTRHTICTFLTGQPTSQTTTTQFYYHTLFTIRYFNKKNKWEKYVGSATSTIRRFFIMQKMLLATALQWWCSRVVVRV